jgi:hypothetical protein
VTLQERTLRIDTNGRETMLFHELAATKQAMRRRCLTRSVVGMASRAPQ